MKYKSGHKGQCGKSSGVGANGNEGGKSPSVRKPDSVKPATNVPGHDRGKY